MPVIPYWVDFAQQPQGGDNRRGSFWGPWVVGNALFTACDNYTGAFAPPNVLRIYKSVDFGVTWVEQDAANEPVMVGDAICHVRDGNTIRTGRIRPVTFDVILRDFDLVTGTWGADYGLAGSPVIPNQNWDGVLLLATGALRFFYSRSALGIRTIYFADYLAGVWTIDNPIFAGGGGLVRSQPGILYSAGLSHGFFSHEPVPFGPHNYFHYSITDAGVVTVDGAACYSDFTGNAIYNVIEVGGDLKASHRAEIGGFYYPALLTGTPAAAPVWSTETVELVNGTTAGVWVTNQAGEIRVWWGFSNFGGGPPAIDQLYYSIRGPLVWGAPVTYWDRLLVPPVPDPGPPGGHWQYGPSIEVFPDAVTFGGWYGVLITVDGPNMTPVYLRPLAPVPPVAPILAQGGSRRMVVLVPNRFDAALGMELEAHRYRRPERPCCGEPILWRDINWVRAPAGFLPFRKVGTVPTPLAVTGDVEVLNFQVPQGYDGVIAGLFHLYTGPGFQEGNGDLQWRIIINRVYAIHLGNVQVSLGSRQQPYPVDGGIFIQSGNRIRYIVNAPNLSGGILPLASQIVCGLEGLFYARA